MRADADVALPDTAPQDAAAALDREADALLHLGFHSQAERLAHRAAELRVLPSCCRTQGRLAKRNAPPKRL
jgi:hypothetical protein